MFVRVGILMVFSRSILVLFGSYAFWNLVGGARPTKTRHSQLFLFKAAWSLLGELVALYRSGYPQGAVRLWYSSQIKETALRKLPWVGCLEETSQKVCYSRCPLFHRAP